MLDAGLEVALQEAADGQVVPRPGHLRIDLEQALEFIDDDELVEVTPVAIRLRKRVLNESDRKRVQRAAENAERVG